MNGRPRRVFISVAEDSADVHGASLLRTAAEHLPGVRFYGLTGPRMRAAGAETLLDFTAHAAMLSGIVKVIGRAWRAVNAVAADWRRQPPDAVVLLDSPELHLRVARRARGLGLPVLYYIAPQTWASRAYRNRRIAADVDRLACILPFEEAYFRGAGVKATFVGHPLFEALQREAPQPQAVARLGGGGPLIALLPGSRQHVIRTMLPLQLDVVRRVRAVRREVRAAISCVDEPRAALVRELLGPTGLAAERVIGDNASLLTAADLVLVASGTATLEVAHYRKPMIVMYDAGRVLGALYRSPLRRMVVQTPHLSLVNILAAARVVPEFMPSVPDPNTVAGVAQRLLADDAWRRLMVRQLDEVVRPLEASQASANVCRLLGDLLAARGR